METKDEWGGIAVNPPTYGKPDEWGGIPVSGKSDEWGGIPLPATALDTIADPISHALQHPEGSPEYESAFQADQALKNRTAGQKLGAIAKTAATLAPWWEGAKNVVKFAGGLAATPLHTAAQAGLTAAAPALDAAGLTDAAQKARNEAQSEGAEAVLSGQNIEQGLKRTGHAIAGLFPNIGDVEGTGSLESQAALEAMTPEEKKVHDTQLARQEFGTRVNAARNQQTLNTGTPLDTGAVAALSRAATGANPSEAFGPENLQAIGARPVSPLTVEAMSAAGDPTNLALAAAPGLPGAKTIAGGATELAGKAMQWPIQAAEYIPGKIGKTAKIIGGGAIGAGTAYEAIQHPEAAAIIGGTLLGAKLGAKLGQILEAQGAEFRTGIPGRYTQATEAAENAGKSTLIPNTQRAIGNAATQAAATAYGFAPVNAITSGGDPEQFAQSEIGAGMFGAGLGAFHRSSSLKAMDQALQGKLMEQHGQTQFSDNPNYPAHEATMATFKPEDQSRLNRLRSYLFGGTDTDVLTVDAPTFSKATGTYIGNDARGKISSDGKTIYINADAFKPGESAGEKAADTTGHEAGHAIVKYLQQMSGETDSQGLMKAIADKLTPEDKAEMVKKYQDSLEGSTKGINPWNRYGVRAQIKAANPPSALIEENLAEITRKILSGEDVSKFTLSKPLSEKVMDAAARMMEAMGLSPAIDQNVSLGFKTRMVKEAARRMQDVLYSTGERARDRRANPTTPDILRELNRQLAAVPAYSDTMPATKAQELYEQREAIRQRIKVTEKTMENDIKKQFPAAGPAPTAPGTPSVPNAANADAMKALEAMKIPRQKAAAAIRLANEQHGSPILDPSDLATGAFRITAGGSVKPGEFLAKPPTPTTPVQIPPNATFTDETGQKRTVTGAQQGPARIGDIVATRDGQIRRITAIGSNGTVDTARPSDPLNARGTFTFKMGDIQPLEHDYAPEQPSAAQEQPKLTVKPEAGGFRIVDEAGNPINSQNYPTEAGAQQAIRQQGQGRFSLPPPMRDEAGNEIPDILHALADQGGGGINFTEMGKEEKQQSLPPNIRGIIGSTDPRNSPDAVAQRLLGSPEEIAHGIPTFGDGTPETMFNLIKQAIEARRNFARQSATETTRQKAEAKESTSNHVQPATPPPNEPLPASANVATEVPMETPHPTESTPLQSDEITQIAAQGRKSVADDIANNYAIKPDGLNLNSKEGRAWAKQHEGKEAISQEKAEALQRKGELMAVIRAHSERLPLNYQGIRLRTDQFGRESVAGTLDGTRPFDAWLLRESGLSPEAMDNLGNLQDAIGKTIQIDYRHASPGEEITTADTRRSAQGKETAQQRAANPDIGTTKRKTVVPLQVTFNPGAESFTVLGASPEKLLSNWQHLSEAMASTGEAVPYRDIHDPRFVADLKGYIRNHTNGWQGDGSAPIVDSQGATQKTTGEPYQIPSDRFEFLNAIMGDEGAKSNSPQGKEKAALAQFNSRMLTPEGETNALRQRLNDKIGPMPEIDEDGQPKLDRAGNPKVKSWSKATLEDPISENIRPDLVKAIHPELTREDTSIREHGYQGDIGRFFSEGVPNRTNISAGFMPNESEGPTLDSNDPAWIQRFEQLYQKDYKGTALTSPEQDELDALQKRIVSQYGSLSAFDAQRKSQGQPDIHEPLREEMRKTPQQRARERLGFMPDDSKSTSEEPKDQGAQSPSLTPQGGTSSKKDTGKPEEGETTSERLTREAEAAGISMSLETIKGLLRSDPAVMDKVRARIQQATGKPARFMPEERFSNGLESEIDHLISTHEDSRDPDDPEDGPLSRNRALQYLMQDSDLPEHPAHDFKKELQDFGISAGIFKPYTKQQIDEIVSSGRGRKYDFKRGDKYYRFESWEPLRLGKEDGSSFMPDAKNETPASAPIPQRVNPRVLAQQRKRKRELETAQ